MIDIFLRFTGLVCIEPVSDETGGTRIVFPIRNDPEGYSGRKGHIHPHYLRLYIATLPPIDLARGEIALELNAINAQGPPTNQFGALVIDLLSLAPKGDVLSDYGGEYAWLDLPAGQLDVNPGYSQGDVEIQDCPAGTTPRCTRALSSTAKLTLEPGTIRVQGHSIVLKPNIELHFANSPDPSHAHGGTGNPDFEMFYWMLDTIPNPPPLSIIHDRQHLEETEHLHYPGLRCVPIVKI